MAFRGFTEAKHKDGALNDLETRVKNTFNQVKNSRILGGSLMSGVKLKSTASRSNHPVSGTGMTTFTVVDWTIIPVGLAIRLGTQITNITRENVVTSPLGRLDAATIVEDPPGFAIVTLATPADISNFSNGMEVTFSPGIEGAPPRVTTTIGYVQDDPADPDYGTFVTVYEEGIQPEDYCSGPPIPTAYDWTAATSNDATAQSIVDAFSEGSGDVLAGIGVEYPSPAKVECIASNGSLREALVSYSPTGTASGVQAGSIIPTVSIIATTDFPDASTSDFSINELIRFGPRAPSSPGDLAPGVFRIKDIGASFGAINYLLMSSLPSSMDVLFPYSTYDSGMYVYKLLRNPIPGVGSGSKYMILNQDRPSKIWSGAGGGNLSLFCDNDCTVDMWVF